MPGPGDRELSEIEERVRGFLRKQLPRRADEVDRLPRATRIWDVVGSLIILELVEYLERAYDFVVEPIEFIPENFESLEQIAAFVAQKAPPAR